MRSVHDRRLDEILNNPSEVGINGSIELAAKEVRVYVRGQLVRVPDIVFYQRSTGLYVVEHKCNDTAQARRKALHQLADTRMIIYNLTGLVPVCVYSHGREHEVVL